MVTLYIPIHIRRLVYARAKGRCEYCLLPELAGFSTHQYDHVIAQKHGGATVAKNLALACVFCNRRKGSDLSTIEPLTGDVVRLFNPRQQIWSAHFQFAGAKIISLTAEGRATANLLQFNLPERVEERELLISVGLFEGFTS